VYITKVHKTFIKPNTVKLANFKRLPNRIKYEFVTANRTRTFLLFFRFFVICYIVCNKFGSVQSNRTSKWTEYNAFRLWRWWIVFTWSVRFDRTESNFFKKNSLIIKIFEKGSVCREKIELTRFSSVRFEIRF